MLSNREISENELKQLQASIQEDIQNIEDEISLLYITCVRELDNSPISQAKRTIYLHLHAEVLKAKTREQRETLIQTFSPDEREKFLTTFVMANLKDSQFEFEKELSSDKDFLTIMDSYHQYVGTINVLKNTTTLIEHLNNNIQNYEKLIVRESNKISKNLNKSINEIKKELKNKDINEDKTKALQAQVEQEFKKYTQKFNELESELQKLLMAIEKINSLLPEKVRETVIPHQNVIINAIRRNQQEKMIKTQENDLTQVYLLREKFAALLSKDKEDKVKIQSVAEITSINYKRLAPAEHSIKDSPIVMNPTPALSQIAKEIPVVFKPHKIAMPDVKDEPIATHVAVEKNHDALPEIASPQGVLSTIRPDVKDEPIATHVAVEKNYDALPEIASPEGIFSTMWRTLVNPQNAKQGAVQGAVIGVFFSLFTAGLSIPILAATCAYFHKDNAKKELERQKAQELDRKRQALIDEVNQQSRLQLIMHEEAPAIIKAPDNKRNGDNHNKTKNTSKASSISNRWSLGQRPNFFVLPNEKIKTTVSSSQRKDRKSKPVTYSEGRLPDFLKP